MGSAYGHEGGTQFYDIYIVGLLQLTEIINQVQLYINRMTWVMPLVDGSVWPFVVVMKHLIVRWNQTFTLLLMAWVHVCVNSFHFGYRAYKS